MYIVDIFMHKYCLHTLISDAHTRAYTFLYIAGKSPQVYITHIHTYNKDC